MDVKKVASYFYHNFHSIEDPINQYKIQKLLYYTQFSFFEITHQPLFYQKTQAWEYGPVVPEVYHEWHSIVNDNPKKFPDPNIQEYLNDVAEIFNKKNGFEMVEMTHEPNSPWTRTWKDGKGRNNEIQLEQSHFDKDFCDFLNVLKQKLEQKKQQKIQRSKQALEELAKELFDFE